MALQQTQKSKIQTADSSRRVMTGNEAVAEAIRLAKPKVVPAYPITPQTSIVEAIARMTSNGTLQAEYIAVESEHSAMSAAIGASLAGTRTFTATSSHGLMYMGEVVFWAGMTRVPVVMAVVNRSLNPWNIWVDHQDSMAFRDAGWIQFYAKNNQEVLDLTLIAFKVAEHHKVWMPAMVCLDGFILSHTSAIVSVPSEELVDKYIGEFDPLIILDPQKPFAHGALTGPAEMTSLRTSIIQGFENAYEVFRLVNKEYQELVGRSYGGLVETIGDKDARIGIMALGTLGEEAEEAVDFLSERGIKTKVVRPRVFRPFPKTDLVKEIEHLEKVLILDRAVSFGHSGQLAMETRAALYEAGMKREIHGKIVGLGGTDINYKQIAEMVEKIA